MRCQGGVPEKAEKAEKGEKSLPMTGAAPKDLIPIAEAEALVGHSRQWMKARVTIYRVGTKDYVSRQAILDAKRDFDTPKPKDGRDEE